MTYQTRDFLYYNGQEYRLNQQLLKGYFEVYPERVPEREIVSTALRKGYLATFEIKDDQLFVRDIDRFTVKPNEGVLARQLFPNQNKYEWYSGLIRIDDYRGQADEEHPGATFEYLEFYKGDFVQKRTMDFEALQAFKARQFEYFKTTPDYDRACAAVQKRHFSIFSKHMTEEEIQDRIYNRLLQEYATIIFDNPFLK